MNKDWEEKLDKIDEEMSQELATMSQEGALQGAIDEFHLNFTYKKSMRFIREVVIPESFKAGANKNNSYQTRLECEGSEYYRIRDEETPDLDQFIESKLGKQ